MLVDFLLLLAIVVVQLCAGISVLTLLRVRVDPEVRVLLAPAAQQAVWACVLNLSVAAQMPVRDVTPFLWAGTLLLAMPGPFIIWRAPRGRGLLLPVCCALFALLALGPYFGKGLTVDYRGSGVPDAWSYVAIGQWLWEHAQDGPIDGLSLLHRYGAAFAHQRHVAMSELGVLSWLVAPGETQAGAGLLQALSVWALATSAAAFARLRGHTVGFAAAVAALTTLSGWVANVIWLSNYDHSLSLTFAPALMALAISVEGMSLGGALFLGLLAAGTMHSYPELSVVVLGTTSAAYAVQAWRDRRIVTRLWLGIVTILTAAALVGIYWPDYVAYLGYQSTTRPALGILQGLIEPRYMASAFWALGGEHRVPLLVTGQTLVALLLFALLVRGGVRLIRRGDWALAGVLLLFLGGAAYGMGVWQYGYGAYKVILSSWWLVAYALVLAAAPARAPASASAAALAASPSARSFVGRVATLAPGLLLLAIPGAVLVRDLLVVPKKHPQPMADLRVLRELPPLLAGQPLALLVDNLDATAWSLYFLRDLPARQMRIGDFSGYVAAPHLRVRVDLPDALPWDRFRYVLTDTEDRGPVYERLAWRLVWRKGAFALWDTAGASWGIVTDVQEGTETVGPPLPAVPLGPAGTRLTLLASAAGTVTLTPAAGSTPASIDPAQLQAACGAQPVTIGGTATPWTLTITVPPGETACVLRYPGSALRSLGRLDAQWTPAGEVPPPVGSLLQ